MPHNENLEILSRNNHHHQLENENELVDQSDQSQLNSFRSTLDLIETNSTSIKMTRQKYVCMSVLFTINLIKYMDRFTIAGVLRDIQFYFKIDDKLSGLIHTMFICSYMLIAPLFGYLGDRYSRKNIILIGLTFWSSINFLSSFVQPEQFWLFVLMRGFLGVGEASFSCIASSMIGDLFTNKRRTQMLSIFCMAMPLGSGLGYIISSNLADIFNDWRWSLRFTPIISIFCLICLTLFVNEPQRGAAEKFTYHLNDSSLLKDIIYLIKNKTFIFTTAGNTFISFVLGGLSFWAPTYVEYAIESKNQKPIQVPLIFGVITCVAGVCGVSLSLIFAPCLRKKFQSKADTLICAFGSLLAVPSLFVAIYITRRTHPIYFWLCTFLAISSLSLSWNMIADIQLYVIQPNKRATATSFNILICHLLGDASSPFLIGAISDILRTGHENTYLTRFISLQNALLFSPVFAALSYVTFLLACIFIEDDRKKVDDLIKN